VPVSNGGFRNLARVLDLEAKVRVERINLPPDVLSEAQQDISTARAENARDNDDRPTAANDADNKDDAELKTDKAADAAE
jgi:hypothetical protein